MIEGFSRLSRDEQLKLVSARVPGFPNAGIMLRTFWHQDETMQENFSSFSENTLSNYYLPYGVAPNFLINGKEYLVPMVTEESSVVAAASSAAKYWASRGGFIVKQELRKKYGQIHFSWDGPALLLEQAFQKLCTQLGQSVKHLTSRMEQRGGGLLDFSLQKLELSDPQAWQLLVGFDTADSMGANFINSCLELMSASLESFMRLSFPDTFFEPVMAILSNYNPHCLVTASVSCSLNELNDAGKGLDGENFARRFIRALDIARVDVYRATTHNKGIMNGIDAVLLATGNDFRAVEAGAHAWASRSGQYRGLSSASLKDNQFSFSLELPMSIGTVGGLTSLHPLAAFSLALLEKPSASDLMGIVAATGLASNFAAVRSLVTSGIQQGHMKMHLANILATFQASREEQEEAKAYFTGKVVSYAAVNEYLLSLRSTR